MEARPGQNISIPLHNLSALSNTSTLDPSVPRGRSSSASSSSSQSRTSSQLELELDELLETSSSSSPRTREMHSLLPVQSRGYAQPSSSSSPHYPPSRRKSSSRLPSSWQQYLPIRFLRYLFRPVRLIILLITMAILFYAYTKAYETYWYYRDLVPDAHMRNAALANSPGWLTSWTDYYFPFKWGTDPPVIYHELLRAPWMGTWELPKLGPPRYSTVSPLRLPHLSTSSSAEDDMAASRYLPIPSQITTPAFMILHVFSTGRSSSRRRRQVIREHHPLYNVDPAYRHLVDIRFILGRPDPSTEMTAEEREEEREIALEHEAYGDVVRLDDLFKGDNMNNGKSWQWIDWVGQGGAGRTAWWVMKCDEDVSDPFSFKYPDLQCSLYFRPCLSCPTFWTCSSSGLLWCQLISAPRRGITRDIPTISRGCFMDSLGA